MAPSAWGSSYCGFWGPSVFNSVVDGRVTTFATWVFSPFNQTFSFSPRGHSIIGASISGLLLGRRPRTVSRRIISIVVDSFNSKVYSVSGFVRPRQECREIVPPLLAHRYSPSSVIFIMLALLGVAAKEHLPVNMVDGLKYGGKMWRMDGSFAGRRFNRIQAGASALTRLSGFQRTYPVKFDASAFAPALSSQNDRRARAWRTCTEQESTRKHEVPKGLATLGGVSKPSSQKLFDYCGIVVEYRHGWVTPCSDSVDGWLPLASASTQPLFYQRHRA